MTVTLDVTDYVTPGHAEQFYEDRLRTILASPASVLELVSTSDTFGFLCGQQVHLQKCLRFHVPNRFKGWRMS